MEPTAHQTVTTGPSSTVPALLSSANGLERKGIISYVSYVLAGIILLRA